jgi:predicted LPLAT superfamily acyltransferase
VKVGSRWEASAERGTLGALRLAVFLQRTLGRRFSRLIIYPVALYFWVSDAAGRRASRLYLDTLYASPEGRAALARAPGPWSSLRHVVEFATNIYDRLLVFGGGVDQVRAEYDERSVEIFRYAAAERGSLLLVSHLGSFDMLRLLGEKHGLVVNFVMFTRHAERINSFLDALYPGGKVRILSLDPTSMRTAFEIRACIERGEFVAIPADRLSPDGRERALWATFLGRPARFPLRPFLLAGALRCPVLMTLCVRVRTGVYETVLRPLGDGSSVPRKDRDKFARETLERYVRTLEEYCYRVPYQWFNFFDIWAGREPQDGELGA